MLFLKVTENWRQVSSSDCRKITALQITNLSRYLKHSLCLGERRERLQGNLIKSCEAL